jgi:glucose/mannose-6-phosphate isomerase
LEAELDSVGMFALTAALPEQVAAAALTDVTVAGLPASREIDNVVVLGMGGSGIAGDIVAACAAPAMAVPVVVVKDYDIPAFVGPGTICFAVSYSGGTEETLGAARAAVEAGAHLVALSNGGALGELAESAGAPQIGLPDLPMPRAGVGAVSIPILVLLEQLGLLPGAGRLITAAVEQLRRRRDELVGEAGSAPATARRIGRTLPVAYGGGALGATAAYRFKCQVNENAKAPAWSGAVPEMCHNEICGWGQHGDVTRQLLTVVRFRHDFEHAQVDRRFELTYDILDEVVHGVIDVVAAGEGRLAQLFDLILQGDFISLHMAAQAGVDPGPIPVLEQIKAALAE